MFVCFCLSFTWERLSKLNLTSLQLTEPGTNMEWAAVCLLYLLWGFCLRLSSHGNTPSKPERQMSAKSNRSNTLLSLFISNQDLSCSSNWSCPAAAGSHWLCFYCVTRACERWRGERWLWSLCVDTREQYVVIKQSWKSISNPRAFLYHRLYHLIRGKSGAPSSRSQVDVFMWHTVRAQWGSEQSCSC